MYLQPIVLLSLPAELLALVFSRMLRHIMCHGFGIRWRGGVLLGCRCRFGAGRGVEGMGLAVGTEGSMRQCSACTFLWCPTPSYRPALSTMAPRGGAHLAALRGGAGILKSFRCRDCMGTPAVQEAPKKPEHQFKPPPPV